MKLMDAREKLQMWGQEHVLRNFDALSAQEQEALLNQIEKTDFSVIEDSRKEAAAAARGVVTPIPAMELPEIRRQAEELRKCGLEEIRQGHVAALLLAGGMGTRLGSDKPKGMFNIGETKTRYIFQCLVENLMDVVKEAGCYLPLFVMTSEKNDADTRAFFEEQNYFGYDPEKVHFFEQEMAPATDFDGKVYMEAPSRIATSPNGNGGWYISMKRSGMADLAEKEGVRWFNVFAVDNVLQRIADPVFVGACVKNDYVCGAKVIRKAERNEKVGVMCLEDAHPSIIEYYEMTDDMLDAKDEKGNPLYNYGVILNYLFRKDKLDAALAKNMPLHMVDKKIPYVNEAGEFINPETPNGNKYETLVLDMIRMMDNCLVFEVEREHEFAPVKNRVGVDSVDTARELLKKNGVEL